MNNILSFSGGKDSTAMALLMLEKGEQCVVTMLSFCLAAVNDVHDQTRHPMRRAVLEALLGALASALKYYDRNLDKWEAYEAAARGASVLEGEMAA